MWHVCLTVHCLWVLARPLRLVAKDVADLRARWPPQDLEVIYSARRRGYTAHQAHSFVSTQGPPGLADREVRRYYRRKIAHAAMFHQRVGLEPTPGGSFEWSVRCPVSPRCVQWMTPPVNDPALTHSQGSWSGSALPFFQFHSAQKGVLPTRKGHMSPKARKPNRHQGWVVADLQ